MCTCIGLLILLLHIPVATLQRVCDQQRSPLLAETRQCRIRTTMSSPRTDGMSRHMIVETTVAPLQQQRPHCTTRLIPACCKSHGRKVAGLLSTTLLQVALPATVLDHPLEYIRNGLPTGCGWGGDTSYVGSRLVEQRALTLSTNVQLRCHGEQHTLGTALLLCNGSMHIQMRNGWTMTPAATSEPRGGYSVC